jgi:hypothetical protein
MSKTAYCLWQSNCPVGTASKQCAKQENHADAQARNRDRLPLPEACALRRPVTKAHPEIRAGDADRAAVADALCAHCSAGRLDIAELEERLSVALAARTVGELDRVLADLPGGRPTAAVPAVVSTTSIKVGLPGLRSFHQRHALTTDRRQSFAQAVAHIAPSMTRVGYDVVAQTEPQMLVFERRARPAWVPFVCIFLFPVGLVSLAFRETQRVVITFDEPGPKHTRMTVQGTARRSIRKAFAKLSQHRDSNARPRNRP